MAGTKVMFTAWADHGGKYGPFGSNKTLIYNKVITNYGGGYNETTGVFTSPVSGVYYFTLHSHAGKGLSLMKNNDSIVATSDVNSGSNYPDNGGNSAFLHLTNGDQVFVRLPADSSVWAAGRTTTFSGFLVGEV